MILGINPGGDPTTWTMPEGADEFCSAWQHDYVDERYPIQAAMLPLLMSSLQVEADLIRRIPKTNMIFRRSSGEIFFREQQGGKSMQSALKESAPVLERIIRRVAPRMILFEGQGALKRFVATFGAGKPSPSLVPPVSTPNGRNRALIYAVKRVETNILSTPITAVVLAHPSKYAARIEFQVARTDMRRRLAAIAEELKKMGSPLPTAAASKVNGLSLPS